MQDPDRQARDRQFGLTSPSMRTTNWRRQSPEPFKAGFVGCCDGMESALFCERLRLLAEHCIHSRDGFQIGFGSGHYICAVR